MKDQMEQGNNPLTEQTFNETIEEQGLNPMLTAFAAIMDEPNDSKEYERWENAYHELLLWIQLTYFHRFTIDDLEEHMNKRYNS